MGIFARIWRVIKGWLLIGVEKAEDPEVILAEAQDSMRRELDKAKESAVQAIAARNQLRQVLQDIQNKSATLEAKARLALKSGDEELARQLLVEKSTYDSQVDSLRAQLAQAEQAAENVKASIKTMEMQVRQRAAEQLALKAGWRQAKIQEQLSKALDNMSLDSQNQAFNRAEERIREMQSRVDARSELAEGGLNQRMAKLDQAVTNERAEAALDALKAEMGMAPATQDDALLRLKDQIAQEAARKEVQEQQVGQGEGGGGGRTLEL